MGNLNSASLARKFGNSVAYCFHPVPRTYQDCNPFFANIRQAYFTHEIFSTCIFFPHGPRCLHPFLSPAAMAQDVPAVLVPDGICTLDINLCGNSGNCTCPNDYEYDSTVGYCLIDDIDDATSRGAEVKSPCSIEAEFIPTTCTDSENQLGHPEKCLCPGSTYYNQLTGQCVVSFR